ncbi:MAG: DMT family transporter, partial [Burkholderiales bacterium]|nr:DMT family transporter [Burkholderiales bacterium]
MQNSSYPKGIFLVVCASLAWGSMAVAVQYLLQQQSVHPGELSALRLFTTGVLLAIIGSSFGIKGMFAPFKDRKLGLQVLLSGVIMCLAHLTFFFSIYYSNAGTGAIFLATQPLLAALYLCLVKHQY